MAVSLPLPPLLVYLSIAQTKGGGKIYLDQMARVYAKSRKKVRSILVVLSDAKGKARHTKSMPGQGNCCSVVLFLPRRRFDRSQGTWSLHDLSLGQSGKKAMSYFSSCSAGAGRSARLALGKHTMALNKSPSTVIWKTPPCSSTKFLAMANPRPLPSL